MAVHNSPAALLVLALGACAQLTAERPLFSVADQGQPPLTEGIWIGVGEECAERYVRVRRFPSECAPLDIRRDADGAWHVGIRIDLVSDLTARERADAEEDANNGPYRVIIASAVERAIGDGYAPLYLAELDSQRDESGAVAYAIVVPTGALPATEMRLAAMIGCEPTLREGPVPGIEPRYETRVDDQGVSHQDLTGCTATTQAAVREAVRRSVIENLNELTQRRYVFVRAN